MELLCCAKCRHEPKDVCLKSDKYLESNLSGTITPQLRRKFPKGVLNSARSISEDISDDDERTSEFSINDILDAFLDITSTCDDDFDEISSPSKSEGEINSISSEELAEIFEQAIIDYREELDVMVFTPVKREQRELSHVPESLEVKYRELSSESVLPSLTSVNRQSRSEDVWREIKDTLRRILRSSSAATKSGSEKDPETRPGSNLSIAKPCPVQQAR